MSFETRTKVISSFATTVIMALLLLLLYVLGLYSQVPPPAPKKMILIEFSPDSYLGGGGGGGGGGGNSNYLGSGNGIGVPSAGVPASGDAINLATQLTDDAPALGAGGTPKPQDNSGAVGDPKPEPGATYRPSGGGIGPGSGGGTGGGRGTGTGTGTGSGSGPGSGSGTGMGIGSGDGSGIGPGKGPGYSSAKRNYVNIPDVNINENGVVYVEVHVTAQGNVINARILSTPKYPTTITNAKIQQECIARASSAKYAAGKEELRIIVFK